MSLRLKLLLLALLTLLLPWAGCRYAAEMESALREGEQTALVGVARTLAASLQGRTDLLFRNAQLESLTPYDLQPVVLMSRPLLDGYPDEWPRDPASWRYIAKDARHRFGILTGVHERMLYVLIEVTAGQLVFDAPGTDPLDASAMGTRIWLGFEDPHGAEQQVFLACTGAGPLTGHRIESGEYGEQRAVLEPRILGALQPSRGGYRVELGIPLSMLGKHFGILIDERAQRGAAPVSYGTLRSDDLHPVGRLIVAAPELSGYLKQFMQPGQRLTVMSTSGTVLAKVDAIDNARALDQDLGLLGRLYRRTLDRGGVQRPIESVAPVYDAERNQPIASLTVAQTETGWLRLRDRALTRMLDLNLTTTAAVVLFVLLFATRLALRLARLRTASETALTREGLVPRFPETGARDELGDLARAFATLLGRLSEYTAYLRTLAGRLAHEIRTPLTIVRSSLENLDTAELSAPARAYLERAREGSERLRGILLAMGAASRVEEAIASAERVRFDLLAAIASAVEAYRIAFPQRQFRSLLPSAPLIVAGAPELIVQMLDKLIDNAVDFSPPGAAIQVRLTSEGRQAILEVENPGPPLPETGERLFEALWQSRSAHGSDSKPHFGLGLYIVRLIAEFHGGAVSARSLPGGSGALFCVSIPLQPSRSSGPSQE